MDADAGVVVKKMPKKTPMWKIFYERYGLALLLCALDIVRWEQGEEVMSNSIIPPIAYYGF